MNDYTCSTVMSSTKSGISGASHHSNSADRPVDSKILMLILCKINKFCITNSIGSLAMNSLYVYIRSMINEVWNL